MIRHFIAAALLAAPPAAAEQQTPAPCLSPEEVAAMSGVFMPAVIDGAASRCSVALPPTAFLRTDAPALTERLRREGDWPRAKAAFVRISGGKVPEGVSDRTLRTMADEMIGAKVVGDIAVADCPLIDRLVGAMSPLPASNIGTIVASLMELGIKDDGGDAPFRICPAER